MQSLRCRLGWHNWTKFEAGGGATISCSRCGKIDWDRNATPK